ncbi:hypothetical protein [Rhodanobacter thiooxydans]|uniref:hypothetical protein n=1 Tax=Rhodanobacter thiooxydans TaxID=416169 RepID=UPI000260D59B|nr:hypothetical protein [Rhodanobacter thiooxydans]EIM03327.1 hypothetical protein UUA_00230 [Rhodanobacter thiooxydans LCS2]
MATRHAPGRGPKRSEYDSSDRLPDIEMLLDRTVQEIQHIHLVRKRSKKTFDRLWERVCGKLAELGNASAYARWRRDDTLRNLDQFQKLDAAVAEAWAASVTPISSKDVVFDGRQFQRLREERSALKLEIEISIDHVLEVAVAYWIEAMNAYRDGDELRAMHALIRCHFNLGIAHALRMTHDTKEDDGRQSGQRERDALAGAVLNVMQNFTVTKSIYNENLLLEGITHAMEADPAYAEVLHSYDALVSNGKVTNDPISTRFPSRLKTWVTGKKPLYPHLALQFKNLAQQIEKKPATRNIVRRKANG